VIRGLNNFYSFADNRARLKLIQYILHHSCAALLARKLNMTSRASVFKKFGSNLTVDYETNKGKETISLEIGQSFKATRKYNLTVGDPLDIANNNLK
jgi:hypothetical protein